MSDDIERPEGGDDAADDDKTHETNGSGPAGEAKADPKGESKKTEATPPGTGDLKSSASSAGSTSTSSAKPSAASPSGSSASSSSTTSASSGEPDSAKTGSADSGPTSTAATATAPKPSSASSSEPLLPTQQPSTVAEVQADVNPVAKRVGPVVGGLAVLWLLRLFLKRRRRRKSRK